MSYLEKIVACTIAIIVCRVITKNEIKNRDCGVMVRCFGYLGIKIDPSPSINFTVHPK